MRLPAVTPVIMRLAASLAPPADKDWIRAMETEAALAQEPGEGVAFALGCLGSVAARRATSPGFLASATQTSTSLGLLLMGAIGVWVSGHLAAALPSEVLRTDSLTYAAGGLLAIWSVRALRVYACFGVAVTGLLAAWFAVMAAPGPLGVYCLAVALEALTLFSVLAVASAAILHWRAVPKGGLV
jgi:hypothetical protein